MREVREVGGGCHTSRISRQTGPPRAALLGICGIWLGRHPFPIRAVPSPSAHSRCISSSGQPCGWPAHPCTSGAAVSQDWLHRCGARPDNGAKDQPRIDVILPPKWSINMGPGPDMRGPHTERDRRKTPRQRDRGRKVRATGREGPHLATCLPRCPTFLRVRAYASKPVLSCQDCGRLVPPTRLSGSV